MTLKFVIILQNLVKAYHRKIGKSKYDRKLTELDVETTQIRSRVNGVLVAFGDLPNKIHFLFNYSSTKSTFTYSICTKIELIQTRN